MELTKQICQICNRKFKVNKTDAFLPHSRLDLYIRNLEETPVVRRYDICPICAMRLHNTIRKMMYEAPRKCDFCKHDLGPKHPDHGKVCKDCVQHSHFQLKSRMGDREKYEWNLFNGEV